MTEYHIYRFDDYNYQDNHYQNNYNSTISDIDESKPLIAMLFLLFLSLCLSCIPRQNINNRTDLRICLISNELPIIIIKNMNEGVCSICLENFIINDEVNKLSCNHMFHKKCLDGWIHNNNCPLCRNIII